MKENFSVMLGIIARESTGEIFARAGQVFSALILAGINCTANAYASAHCAVICLEVGGFGGTGNFPVEIRVSVGRILFRFRPEKGEKALFVAATPEEIADKVRAGFDRWIDRGSPELRPFGQWGGLQLAEVVKELGETIEAAEQFDSVATR